MFPFPDDAGRAAVAGIAGGIVRWLTLRESPKEGAVALVVGGITAVYLNQIVAPVLEPYLGQIAPGTASSVGAFVCGLAGISLTGLIMDVIRIRRGKLPPLPPETPIADAVHKAVNIATQDCGSGSDHAK
jgi:hypothetical protein